MAGVAVVALDGDGVFLAGDVPFRRQDFGERLPAVGVKDAPCEVLDLVVEPSERCRITSAEHPGDSLP